MRYENCFKLLLVMIALFLFSGCVAHDQANQGVQEEVLPQTVPGFQGNNHLFSPEEWQPVPVSSGMVKKVNNFTVIFDNSASMTEKHYSSSACSNCHESFGELEYVKQHIADKGSDKEYKVKNVVGWVGDTNAECLVCHSDYAYTKSLYAKRVASYFNRSIPDLELESALRIFGAPVYTKLISDRAAYVKDNFGYAIEQILYADGASPLDFTFNAVEKDWFASEGKLALILFSDGKDMTEEDVLSAKKFKIKYGERACIYTIQIGNDVIGKTILEKIAKAGECGLAVNGENLLNKPEMAAFVTEVFLTEGIGDDGGEKDSDNDGVPDVRDDCPGTKPGLEVDERGCWKLMVLSDVLFDFDKYNLKPAGTLILDQVAELLEKHKFLLLHMGGHTDNKGSMEYNIGLSKRRVTAGYDYLVGKGISADRITTSWHSFSIPKASNATSEGRSLNRRIEFSFKK